jgi:catechol 2,3-dioxygenase
MSAATQAVRFRPRRLGHANLWVGDLEATSGFYNRVLGLEEVRREPEITASFLSNGNTHHDLGLLQAKVTAHQHKAKDGKIIEVKGRDCTIGLNHLGWEMDNEAQLVSAWERAKKRGDVVITRTVDHQISHSVYVSDPDGNQHEFYADATKDWRSIFNPERDDLVTRPWDPAAGPPSTERNWPVNPDIRQVAGSVFHPRNITHAGLVAANFEAMQRFFVEVAGLDVVEGTASAEQVVLRGESSHFDLALIAARNGRKPGLRYIAFLVPETADLKAAQARAAQAGVKVSPLRETSGGISILVRDPDGLDVVLYSSEDAFDLTAAARIADQ